MIKNLAVIARIQFLVVAIILTFTARPGQAASGTWNIQGGTNVWELGTNWTPNTIPSTNDTATFNSAIAAWSSSSAYSVNNIVFYSGTNLIYICSTAHAATATTPNLDTANWNVYTANNATPVSISTPGGLNIKSITSTLVPFTIGDVGGTNPLLLGSGGTITISSGTFSFNAPLVMQGSTYTISSSNGTINGNITNGSGAPAVLTLDSPNGANWIFTGIISDGPGANKLSVARSNGGNGPPTVTLTGASTYSGNTTISTNNTFITLSGPNGALLNSPNIFASNGSTFRMDNTSALNLFRLNPNVTVNLSINATMCLTPNAGNTTGQAVPLGSLVIDSGSSVVQFDNNTAGDIAYATKDFTRSNYGTMGLFSRDGFGLATGTNRRNLTIGNLDPVTKLPVNLKLVGTSTAAGDKNLKIIPYTCVTDNNGATTQLMTYNPSGGLVGFRNLLSTEYYTSIASSPSDGNVKYSAIETVSGPKTINALFMTGGNALTGTGELTIASGCFMTTAAAIIQGFSKVNFDSGEAVLNTNVSGNMTMTSPIDVKTNGTHDPAGALTKWGGNFLILAASNLYSGQTNINSGTLQIGVGTTGDLGTNTAAIANYGTLMFGRTDSSLILPNPILGTGSIVQAGLGGTTTLSGLNSYTGTTTIFNSTLNLDYSFNDNNKLSDTSALILNGGTVIIGGGTYLESVSGTTLNGGASGVQRTATGTNVLRMGTITRANSGGTLFYGTIDFSASNIAQVNNTNTGGILGGWATVGGVDWAVNSSNTTNGPVVALSNYTSVNRLDDVSAHNTISSQVNSNIKIVEAGTSGNIKPALSGTTDIGTLLNSAGGGPAVYQPIATGDILRLGASGGILNISTAGSLTIGTVAAEGTLTAGGATNAAGTVFITNNSANNGVIVNSTISNNGTGAVAITKAGQGSLTINSANGYTGGTILNAGKLNINNAAALGGAAALFTINGGTIDNTSGAAIVTSAYPMTFNADIVFAGTNNLTLAGTGAFAGPTASGNARTVTTTAGTLAFTNVISGTNFRLVKAGAGTLTLSATNTFSGGATLNAGTVNINSAQALGTNAANFVINGGTIDNSSGAAVTTVNYPLTINANFVFTGTRDLNLGTGATNLGSASGTSRTVTANAGILTIAGVVSNGSTAANIIKAGNGTLSLNGANIFTGGVTINAGTVVAAGATAIGPAANATVTFGPGTTNGKLQVATATSTVLALNSDAATPGTPIVESSAVSSTLTVNSSTIPSTFSGVIQNGAGTTFSLTKTGTANLTLSGASTYTGATTIGTSSSTPTAARLTLTGSLGATAVSVLNSGSLFISGANVTIGTGATTAGGTVTLNGSTVAASRGTLDMTDGAIGKLTIQGNTTGGNFLTFGTSSVLVFETDNLTTDSIVVSSPGKVSLAAAGPIVNIKAISGTTLPSGSYTLMSFPGGISTGSFVLGSTPTDGRLYSLTLSPAATPTSLVLNVVDNMPSTANAFWKGNVSGAWNTISSGSSNFYTDVSGAANLTNLPGSMSNVTFTTTGPTAANLGNGLNQDFQINSLNFNGNNGATPITIGAPNNITINAAGVNSNTAGNGINMISGTSGVTVKAGIILGADQVWTNNSATQSLTIGGPISGNFGVTKDGIGTLIMLGTLGAEGYTGATTISLGTLQLGEGTSATNDAVLSATSSIVDNAKLLFNNVGSQAYSIIISGTGTIQKSGTGTITLSGNNTFMGQVTIDGGILAVPTVNDSGTTGPLGQSIVSVVLGKAGATGTLEYTGSVPYASTNRAFTIANTGTGAFQIDANTLTVSGLIDGGATSPSVILANLTKTGAGTLVLTNPANSYTGVTTVSTGILQLGDGTFGHDGTISSSSSVTITSTLMYNNFGPQTYSNQMTGAGSLVKTGPGTLSLANTNTYAGATTINNGALVVSGAIAAGAVTINGNTGTGGAAAQSQLRGTGFINGAVTTFGTPGLYDAVVWPGVATNTSGLSSSETLVINSTLNLATYGKLSAVITPGSNQKVIVRTATPTVTLGGSSALSFASPANNQFNAQAAYVVLETQNGSSVPTAGIFQAFSKVITSLTQGTASTIGTTGDFDVVYRNDTTASVVDYVNPVAGSTLPASVNKVVIYFNNSNAVTPVKIAGFTARNSAAGVVACWTAISEYQNAGFNIYRSVAGNSEWVRVNATLIPGRITNADAKEYSYYDWAPPGMYEYKLESIGLRDEREIFMCEPALVTVDNQEGSEIQLDDIDAAILNVSASANAASASDASAKFQSANLANGIAETRLNGTSRLFKGTVSTPAITQRNFASTGIVFAPTSRAELNTGIGARWFSSSQAGTSTAFSGAKVIYDFTGVLKIPVASLPAGLNAGRLAIQREGRALPVLAKTEDSLIVFAPGYQDDYTKKDALFLRTTSSATVSGSIIHAQGLFNSMQSINVSSKESVTMNYHDVYFDYNNAFRPYTYEPWFSSQYLTANETAGSVAHFTVTTPNANSEAGSLTATLWSLTSSPEASPDHALLVLINGQPCGQVAWSGGNRMVQLTVQIPSGVLVAGDNRVDLVTPVLAGVNNQISFLHSLTIFYTRMLDGSRPISIYNEGTTSLLYEVNRVPSPDAWVVDARFPDRAALVPFESIAETGGTYRIRFNATCGGTGQFLVVPQGMENAPLAVSPRQVKPLKLTGPYLATGPIQFGPGVQPLFMQHAKENIRGQFVDQEQIFDYYNYGRYGPSGIQKAVQATRPQYLLLVGRTTYDYRNYSGQNVDPLCPAFLVPTSFWAQATSDSMFGDLGRGYSEVAVGRLPVSNTGELSEAVRHILSYAGAPVSGVRVHAVADRADPLTANFPAQADNLSTYFPDLAWQPNYLGTTYNTSPDVTRAMTTAANGGADWILYAGHGNAVALGNESPRILDTESVRNWTGNVVFLQSTCTANWMAKNVDDYKSITIQALTQPQGGICASIGTSTYMNSDHAVAFMRQLMSCANVRGARWGSAVMQAQHWAASQGTGFYIDLNKTEQLFGDPAMSVFSKTPGSTNPGQVPTKPGGGGGIDTVPVTGTF